MTASYDLLEATREAVDKVMAVDRAQRVAALPHARETSVPVKYEGLLPDTFFQVEATDEADAQRKCLAKLRELLDDPETLEHFIVWEAPQPVSEHT